MVLASIFVVVGFILSNRAPERGREAGPLLRAAVMLSVCSMLADD
jgi:hypothetical protein